MKSLQEVFHMLIAAVICLMVSIVPGKNMVKAVMDEPTEKQVLSTEDSGWNDRFTQKVMDKVRCLWISSYLKRNRMWKKLFFWMQGPGDRKAVFSVNKKTAFGNG